MSADLPEDLLVAEELVAEVLESLVQGFVIVWCDLFAWKNGNLTAILWFAFVLGFIYRVIGFYGFNPIWKIGGYMDLWFKHGHSMAIR